jgi:tetratricopeptide (TPR) repeat protein
LAWEEAFDEGEFLESEGEPEEALEAYNRAEAIHPELAVLHHRIGRTLYALEEWEESKIRFDAALEADEKPVRAGKTVRNILRRCAEEFDAIVVDVDGAFVEALGDQPMDMNRALLVDGVHLTRKGNQLAAEVIARALAEADFPVPLDQWQSYEELFLAEEILEEEDLGPDPVRDTLEMIKLFGRGITRLARIVESKEDAEEQVRVERHFEKAAELVPDRPHGVVGMALLLAWRGEDEAARLVFSAASPQAEAVRLLHDATRLFPSLHPIAEEAGLFPDEGK